MSGKLILELVLEFVGGTDKLEETIVAHDKHAILAG